MQKPKYLYKFHSLNVFLIELLVNGEFYMAKKSELNDPLDSSYTLSYDNYIKLYDEKNPSLRGDPKHAERVKTVFDWKLDSGHSDIIKDISEEFYEMDSKQRITCFTEDGQNPLMWSHYTSNHNGVCIRFDTEKDNALNSAISPVQYLDELIEIKRMDDLNSCLLTKLKAWQVEREWRIITTKDKFEFKKKAVVEIVLGLNVRESTMKWLAYLCENMYYHAAVYQMKVRGNKLVKVNAYNNVVSEDDVISEFEKWYHYSSNIDIGPL